MYRKSRREIIKETRVAREVNEGPGDSGVHKRSQSGENF